MDASARRGTLWLCLLFAGGSVPALAQTPGPTPEWHYSEGHLLDAYMKDRLPKWDRVLGIAAITQPKFDGGDAYSVSGGPTFDIRYYDLAFASAGEGIGVNLLHEKNARAGFALVYDLGRNAAEDHYVDRLGNISFAPGVKAFAEYLLFPVTFRADIRRYFGGVGGYAADLSAYSPLAGKEKVFFLFAGPSVSFGDADNLRHYFGVSPAQSANSGYPEHGLGGGVRSYSFGISGGYFLSEHLIAEGFVAGRQLIGGAGSAPFVQQRGELTAQTTLVYRW